MSGVSGGGYTAIMRGLVYARVRSYVCARFSPWLHRSRAFARPNSPGSNSALRLRNEFYEVADEAAFRKEKKRKIILAVFSLVSMLAESCSDCIDT